MGRVPTSRRNVFVYRFRINDIAPSAGTYNGSRDIFFFQRREKIARCDPLAAKERIVEINLSIRPFV